MLSKSNYLFNYSCNSRLNLVNKFSKKKSLCSSFAFPLIECVQLFVVLILFYFRYELIIVYF